MRITLFTVEAVKPLTSARGYKADRAPHDKKTDNAGAYTKFQA